MENLTEDKRPILIEFAEKTAEGISEFLNDYPEPRGVYAKQQIAEIIFRNAEEFKLHYRAPFEESGEMTQTDHAFKWLEDHGYPTAAMSQLEGYTTFLLAPILAEYASHAPSEAAAPMECEGCRGGLATNHNLGPLCKLASAHPPLTPQSQPTPVNHPEETK